MNIWRTFGVVVHEDELEDVAVDVVDRVEVSACITRHTCMHENESRVAHRSRISTSRVSLDHLPPYLAKIYHIHTHTNICL